MTLREVVQEAVAKYGSQSAAAEAAGVDRTRLGKILQDVEGRDTFEVATCLRLARIVGRSPSKVLRAAGKLEEAELIEAMYGPEHDLVLTPDERQIITLLREADGGSFDPVVAISAQTRMNQVIGDAIRRVVERRIAAERERTKAELETRQNREHEAALKLELGHVQGKLDRARLYDRLDEAKKLVKQLNALGSQLMILRAKNRVDDIEVRFRQLYERERGFIEKLIEEYPIEVAKSRLNILHEHLVSSIEMAQEQSIIYEQATGPDSAAVEFWRSQTEELGARLGAVEDYFLFHPDFFEPKRRSGKAIQDRNRQHEHVDIEARAEEAKRLLYPDGYPKSEVNAAVERFRQRVLRRERTISEETARSLPHPEHRR